MFNENKGFKLYLDGEIVGMVRIGTEVFTERRARRMLIAVHFGKATRKDLEACQLVLWRVMEEIRMVPWFKNHIKIYITNFLPILKDEDLGFATPADNGSLVPLEEWF